jgi:hypothetical protein
VLPTPKGGVLGWFGIVRKILGKITDVLLIGRSAGLWSRKHGPK